jgi:four helix bundle protein
MGARVERFEDLIAWQKARVLRREIGRLTRAEPFRRDPGLADQMRRSARSIMANIAEGFDKHTRPEFHRFLGIAKGSCAELRSDLYAAIDDAFITRGQFDELYALCDEQSRIIAGLRQSLRRRSPEIR